MPNYGSLSSAEVYFTERLFSDAWFNATIAERQAALVQATRIIDTLNFVSEKSDITQDLQFPRFGDTEVPIDIEMACYEEAINLLDGADPERNLASLGVTSDAFSGVRTSFDSSYTPPHILCGLTSQMAYNFLVPYIRQTGSVRLSRKS